MQNATDAVMVYVSVPDETLASEIAVHLLEHGQVACCQTVGPMHSQYRWQGKIVAASEYLLLLKTQRQQLAALESAIQQMHPYDVPEIVVTTISAGHAPYLDWLRQETTGNSA